MASKNRHPIQPQKHYTSDPREMEIIKMIRSSQANTPHDFLSLIANDPFYRAAAYYMWQKWMFYVEEQKKTYDLHVQHFMILIALNITFKIIGDGNVDTMGNTGKRIKTIIKCFREWCELQQKPLPSVMKGEIILATVWHWRLYFPLQMANEATKKLKTVSMI